MPRQARKESGSGIYHVMLRGINRQDIFEEAEDYMRQRQLSRLTGVTYGVINRLRGKIETDQRTVP